VEDGEFYLLMIISDISDRYSPNGGGYIKMYRKLLTSAVFENSNLLKIWIWCLIRANWTETATMFDGGQIPLEVGQFITGRYSGSGECGMNPSTFYKLLKKLEQIGNVKVESDNKKTKITVVNYIEYQGLMSNEWQQGNNKVTTKGHQSNTDKEVKNKRIEEKKNIYIHFVKPSLNDIKIYMDELQIPDQAEAFFDYYNSNGWKIGGKASMKDWKSACRNWKRNQLKYSKTVKPSKLTEQARHFQTPQ
jgi:hypothetical protein